MSYYYSLKIESRRSGNPHLDKARLLNHHGSLTYFLIRQSITAGFVCSKTDGSTHEVTILCSKPIDADAKSALREYARTEDIPLTDIVDLPPVGIARTAPATIDAA